MFRMIGRDEISVVPHSQDVLGRHDPNKSISGYDSSLMMKKSKVIQNDENRGESSVTPRMRRLISSKRRRRSRRYVRSYGSTAVQELMKSTLLNCFKVFNYVNIYLFGLVAAKYQGKSEDPFKANPAPSWSSLAAIVMYFLIALLLMQFHSRLTRFLPFLSRVAFASGAVSSLSLISLLLPKLPGLLLICAAWALFVVISWWPTLESAYVWLLTKIRTATDVVIYFVKKLFISDINSEQQRPPV